jgi:hypothetical protein
MVNFEKWGTKQSLGVVQSILMFALGLQIIGIKEFLPATHTRNLRNYKHKPIPSMFLW